MRGAQETPGIKGEPKEAAEALANYMHNEQKEYADQEACLNVPRGELKDGRVDCVLYFLPTNARIGESNLDFTVINALAAYAPVIPLMCKVRNHPKQAREFTVPCKDRCHAAARRSSRNV